jgi:hypothetical protein
VKPSGTVGFLMRSSARSRARATLAALALVALGACASTTPNANPPSGGSTSPSPSASATPSTGASRSPGASQSPRATPGKTGKPSPKATSSGGATATLSKSCARRGVDYQTITITMPTPGGPASYQTYYSDGSYAADGHSHYSSGFGGGFDGDGYSDPKPADGRWQATWLVPANAPTGLATVAATTAQGRADVKFNIVAKDGHC